MTRIVTVQAEDISMNTSLTSPEVTSFVERLRDCKSLLAADAECQLAARTQPGFHVVEPNRYFFRGHDIALGISYVLGRQAQVLEAFEAWQLNTLPKLVADVRLNHHESALVTRVGPPEGAPPVPLSRWGGPIESAHAAAVHADVDNLAGQGIMNGAFQRGLEAWAVEPSTGRIVVSDWSRISAFRREDLAPLHQRIDETFDVVARMKRS